MKVIIAKLAILVWLAAAATIAAQPVKKSGTNVTDKDPLAANYQQQAIARLFAIVNELKGEADTPGAALLQSEIADVLWRFDEAGARVIFRTAFDSLRQMKIDSSSSVDTEAKILALSRARRRANALKTVLKRYGLRDRKGAAAWLQDFENELEADRKDATRSSRMSVDQAELLAEMAAGLVGQDAKEAARLGAVSLTADSIPPAFTRLLMALRSVDKQLSDDLFRRALLSMRTSGLRYDPALVGLTNYQFFANGSIMPGALSADVALITQYFVDAASAQLALLRSGAFSPDEQRLLGNLYSFLSSRAVPVVALNSPSKLTLLQSDLAEIARGLTVEQRQQAEMLNNLSQSKSQTGDDHEDLASQIHRIEQEKNSDTRDLLFRNLALQWMRTQPEKALDVARTIDDPGLRAQSEDDVYLVLLENALRSGSDENARNIALKINDMTARARWLAEIATKSAFRWKDKNSEAAKDLLSEAYTIAAKSDNNPAKLDALLFIAQEFLPLDRDRGFDILAEALRSANRIDPKPETSLKVSPVPTRIVMSITVVNGKERSTGFRPTLDSIDFNEIRAFAEKDFAQTSSLGDSLKDHLLRAKYGIALARSVLGVPREGSAYEPTLEDLISH